MDRARDRRGGITAAVISGIAVALLTWAVGSAAPGPTSFAAQSGPTGTSAQSPGLAAGDGGPQPTASASSEASAGPSLPPGPAASDGQPQPATLDIAAVGVRGLPVQPYLGRTDDRAGTALQNSGIAASPHGPAGGTGPGGIGNYQVTAHRNTAGGPLRLLPRLVPGHRVEVTTRTHRYVYEITETRQTSFRSPRSLQEQRAAVPGHPGASPTSAMITISTCLTQEDHAAGNYWRDEFDNPEHRIDKIGVLVDSTPR